MTTYLTELKSDETEQTTAPVGPSAWDKTHANVGNTIYQPLAGLLYFMLAKFGMTLFALTPSNITLLWLPSGVALIMFLHWGLSAFPWIVLASFAANAEGMGGFDSQIGFYATLASANIDAAAGFIAAFFFKRHLPAGLKSTSDLLPFIFWVCLLTTGLTSLALSLNLFWGGYIARGEILGFIRMLVLADSLGILLVYPIYQGWVDKCEQPGSDWRWVFVSLFTICGLFMLTLFGSPFAVFFILPALLLLAFRIGLMELGLVMAVSMAFITALTAGGYGPLIAESSVETNLRLVSFLFASTLTVLGIALQQRQLQTSEVLVSTWKRAASKDALTGLFNRRAFFSTTEERVNVPKEQARPEYALAVLDLDHFKCVNDTHGHSAGDQVLKHFAELLTGHCRHTDIVARIGGEEFAVWLPDCSAEFAVELMEQFRQSFAAKPLPFEAKQIRLSVSIGVSAPRNKDEALTDVLARADEALYEAKKGGRNQVVLG